MFWFILVIVFIFFGIYFYVPNFIGFDSYYYINSLCHGAVLNRDIVETLIFSVLSCDFFLLKGLQALSLTITLYLIFKTAQLNYKFEEKLLPLALIGLSPICFYYFFKFENDFFAYPFLALTFYFFNKAKIKNFYTNTALSLTSLFISFSIYELTGYFILIAATTNFIYFILAFLSLHLWFPNLISGNPLIAEQLPIIGLINIGFWFCFIKWKSKKETIASLVLIAIQTQLSIFALFVFSQNIAKTLEWLQETYKEKMLLIPIVIVSVLGLLLMSTLPLVYYPNEADLNLIKTTIENHKDELILNDFELGYIMQGYDYNTPYFSSLPIAPFETTIEPFIAITKQDLNCLISKQTRHYKVYKCNQ